MIKIKTKVGVPKTTSERGREILTDKLQAHLDIDQINDLESSISDTVSRFLTREGISQHDKRAVRIYDQYLRKVCIHLDPESPINKSKGASDVLEQIQSGQINIGDIPRMSILSLDPKAWEKQLATQQAEALQIGGAKRKAAAGILECIACKKAGREYKNVQYREKQDRSADEAATIHAECNTCGKKWTQ